MQCCRPLFCSAVNDNHPSGLRKQPKIFGESDISIRSIREPVLDMTRVIGTNEEGIKETAEIVRRGGVVAFPTDTVYGLGCDPFNSDAVDRLLIAKKRVKGVLPILVSSLDEAMKIGRFNDSAKGLSERFWPGPLTLVVPLRAKLSTRISDGTPFIGLRIPNLVMTRKLIDECGGSLVGTSANLSGNPSPRTANDVIRDLGGRIDLVLDGGSVPIGVESTVVRVADNVVVLREGAIARDSFLEFLVPARLA